MFGNKLNIFTLTVLMIISLKTNAQIEKLYRGDTIRQDSAVCLPVSMYRTVRLSVSSCDQLIESKDILLTSYQEQMSILKESITDRDIKISAMEAEAVRKDSLTTAMHRDFVNLQVTTTKTLVDIEKRLPNKFIFKRFDFWVGVAIGAGGSFLLLR